MFKALKQWYRWSDVAALAAGALVPLSLAPFALWPLGMLAAAALAVLLSERSPRRGFVLSFWFGLGMFGAGASWVYVAIHDFGMASAPLAIVLTGLFVLGLALVFALPFVFYCRWLSTSTFGKTAGFSAVWVLGEWLRSWLLTGFPWLYIGYAHADTWLAGWAPLWGVFGLSFLAVLSGTFFARLMIVCVSHVLSGAKIQGTTLYIGGLLLIWLPGLALLGHGWNTEERDTRISVAIVQPNVPLEVKWNPLFREEILNILRSETQQHFDKDLILWPEAAVPIMYHDAQEFLQDIGGKAAQSDTGIITGILYDDATPGIYYNSIVGLGAADGIYFKQRLVPFGEYVPLEKWLRGIIAFFDLPNSVIYAGPGGQAILSLGPIKIAPSICYEIVYPDLVATLASDAAILLTISNDAWFGRSIGPAQHFQMARMRALENRRHVLRSTNTGISGLIDPYGKVVLQGEQFVRQSLVKNEVSLHTGRTPYSYWKSLPVVLLCLLLLAGQRCVQLYSRQKKLVHLEPDT